MKIGDHETHPAADAFPLMRGAAFRNLVDDIKRNGLRSKPVRYKGSILDGRNRVRACLELDIEPEFEDYDGDSPIAFVVSANISRRHLNESQRAMVATRLATMRPGANRKNTRKLADVPTQAEAAALLNVSERSVQKAREVIDGGVDEVIAAVEGGEMTLTSAAELGKLPVEKQRELAAAAAEPITGGEIRRAVREATGDNQEAVDPALLMLRAIVRAFEKLGASVKQLNSAGLQVGFHGNAYLVQILEQQERAA